MWFLFGVVVGVVEIESCCCLLYATGSAFAVLKLGLNEVLELEISPTSIQ